MEIMGMLKALEWINKNSIPLPIKIYTDSMYVINTMTKNWKRNKKPQIAVKSDEVNSAWFELEKLHRNQ